MSSATRGFRGARAAFGALAAALALSLILSLNGCALCAGGAAPGRPPEFDGLKAGSRVRVWPASGRAWDGVAERVVRRGGETLVCGTLDDGGAFWIVRRGENVSGQVHPTGRRAIWLAPSAGAVADPADPVADEAGICGTGGTLRRWIRKGERSLGSSPGSTGLRDEDVARPHGPDVAAALEADRGLDADSDGDGLNSPPQDETLGGPQGTAAAEIVTIRVAFLLTPAAEESLRWNDSMVRAESFMRDGLAYAETCMTKSKVPAGFDYAGRGTYPFEPKDFDGDGTNEAESVDSVVEHVFSGGPAGFAAITKIRNETQADLVCIVTGPFPGAAGWAPVIADWPKASKASTESSAWVVMRSDTLQGNTFAHEVAHVLGSVHQRGRDPADAELRQHCSSRGWACEIFGKKCATVECQTIGTGGAISLTPIPFYSTADVRFPGAGVPLGEPHDPTCTVDTSKGADGEAHKTHTGADSAATFRITAPYLAKVR